jgi:NAD(P)-dependent dehydrogenase (short-subunit alcohol dehydrogenase family)
MSTVYAALEGTLPMSDPLFDIDGRSIVVAGAASGLGRAVARALAARGARLTVADISTERLETLGKELGAEVATCATDITKETANSALMGTALERFGAVDGVVNTVGLLRIGAALELHVEQFEQTLNLNVTGAFLLSRAAARAMDSKGGRIIHFASVSSVVANNSYAAYATSKAALSQLVRVLAKEWAANGISVNAIGPAMTETGMTAGYLSDPEFRKQALAAIPMGRFGTPEDLFGLLVLLLAPAGAFITGQTIFVDGGRTLV